MLIAVLGTGAVGQTLAAGLDGIGHEVTVGTRNPSDARARTEPDAMGTPGVGAWLIEHPGIAVATFEEAAADADLVVNATNGAVSLSVLEDAGAGNLAGKVLVDVSNPLDFSQGFPPSLFIKDTDSLAEHIQRAFPDARVVKTLNTMNAHLMTNPQQLAGGDHSVFVSGDDASAKQTVTELLRSLGHVDVIDLGDITTARASEMLLPVWLRLYGALGTPVFNFKIVR